MSEQLPAVTAASIEGAYLRVAPFIRKTPLEYSPWLSEMTQAMVYLKLENTQVTGSFKVRGALNALLSLSAEKRRAGVVAASTGNHGAGVAYAAQGHEV